MATIDDLVVIQRILAHLELPGARAGLWPPSSGAAARAGLTYPVIGDESPGVRGGLCGAPRWTAPARRLEAPL
jgi:hypothetical protein